MAEFLPQGNVCVFLCFHHAICGWKEHTTVIILCVEVRGQFAMFSLSTALLRRSSLFGGFMTQEFQTGGVARVGACGYLETAVVLVWVLSQVF